MVSKEAVTVYNSIIRCNPADRLGCWACELIVVGCNSTQMTYFLIVAIVFVYVCVCVCVCVRARATVHVCICVCLAYSIVLLLLLEFLLLLLVSLLSFSYHRFSFPWYLSSWANGEPYHSALKPHIIALSLCVMILVWQFFL
jgi:hypothetical protein